MKERRGKEQRSEFRGHSDSSRVARARFRQRATRSSLTLLSGEERVSVLWESRLAEEEEEEEEE